LVAKKLQESAEVGEAGEESGMEIVDEATVVEAARHVESILGIDTRKNIARTTRQPWRHICALRIEFPSGKVYTGTGFFVGPRAVVTAGHCVYLHNQGGWARKIMVIPGANGSSQPLGSAISTTFRSVGGWVNGKKPECDYGCVILPSGTAFRSNPGSLGFAAFDTGKLLAKTAVLYGYPGDKPFGELWGDKRRIKTVTSKNLIYEIDTMGGQSGSPVYIKQNGQRFAVGIHNYGGATSNSATRITQDVYRRLYAWSQIGGM
jgi:V8-like Glu-specific endopeptidase